MFVEHVLIPVFNTSKVEDRDDKSQTHLEDVDKRPRALKKDILSKASENNFVRNTTLARLKKLESDGIIEIKRGAGGGYYLNYKPQELMEQIENKEQILKHPQQHMPCIKEFIETNINNGSGTLYIDNKLHNRLEGADLEKFLSRYYQFL
jgi:DNA-binding IscR family transcriptional regulator